MRLVFGIICFTIGFVGTQYSAIAAYHLGALDLFDSLFFGIGVGIVIGIFLVSLFWGK